MKKLVWVNASFALLLIYLTACQREAQLADVYGVWVGSDGATLEVEKNGNFSAHSFSQTVFISPDQTGPTIEGSGRWKLVKGEVYPELRLEFANLSGRPSRTEIKVLVSGSGNSTNLYKWKYEEGGERYEMERRH